MPAKRKRKLTYNMALLLICIGLFVAFGLVNNAFFTLGYIKDMLKITIEIGIMALPLTVLIVMGCIDFSMCTTLALAASVGGMVAAAGYEVLGLIVTLLVGALCGSFNGFMVAKMKLPPLITTLATMYLYKGIAKALVLGTGYGTNVPAGNIALFLGSGKVLGVMTQLWIFIILAVFFQVLLNKTIYGRTYYAIGTNENATIFSGISTVKIKFIMYIIGGVVFAIAGLVLMGRFSTIQYDSADSYLMQIIIACVLGGASMSGGRGTIVGTLFGVMVIGILKGGMNVVLLPQTQQKIILGIIMLGSLIAFELIDRRDKKIQGKERIIAAALGKSN